MKAYGEKEALRKQREQREQDTINSLAERYDTITAYVLHTKYGFGRKRIFDFIKSTIDTHIYTNDLYGRKYQDAAYFEALRKDGIDMHEIEQELDAYAKEKGIEY